MAKVVKKSFGSSNTTMWKTFFDSFECPLLTVTISGNTLQLLLDNTVQLNMPASASNWFQPVTITYNGSTTSEVVRLWFGNAGVRVTVITSDTLFYVQFQDGDSRRLCFVYELCDGIKYYGYRGSVSSSGQSFYDISSFGLTNLATDATYTHKPMMGFNSNVGKISYIDKCGLMDSDYQLLQYDTNFIDCTTVIGDKIYTFDGNNYYSVGTNTLVLIDE